MADLNFLLTQIKEQFSQALESAKLAFNEITIEIKKDQVLKVCQTLRDAPPFQFDQLVDVCGVDYLHYGLDDWQTETATFTGFSRGATDRYIRETPAKSQRFAVVYHLLSHALNQRLRVRVNLSEAETLLVDSVIEIWPSADWYEREAFDLYGILFKGHPDLRRILTDYGFVGHPFRKDFPLIGKVEARYDATAGRVIYEPVSIEPRILEPKVIRHDNRYLQEDAK